MSSEYSLSPTILELANSIIIGLAGSYLIFSLGTSIYNLIYNLYFHPLANYPGPASRAAFLFPDVLSRLRGTAYKDTRLLHVKYGSVVRVQPNALSYITAQAWKDIYSLKPDRTELAKPPGHYGAEANHIICADQADHTRMRKLLSHCFSDSALVEQEPLLTSYFELLVAKLNQQIDGTAGGRVDMMAYYTFTTFDIIGDLTFGESFGALESGVFHSWIRNVFEAIKFMDVMRFATTYPAVGFLLFKLLKIVMPSLSAKQAAHVEFITAKVQKRLDRKTDRKDFTTYILRHNDERGMTREEIMGNSRILVVAGSETTATLLSGATYYLIQNPDVLHRVQSEVREAFRTADDITLRSVSAPGQLPYLEAVLQESFRCYPAVPATLPRVTGPQGELIDGALVPANIIVSVNPWSANRSADNFAEPDTFAPERWLPDPPAKYRADDGAAMQPFSLGPRGCIGKKLAYFELRAILSRVLWHFDMELEKESQGWPEQKVHDLWDKPPLWIKLTRKADN